MAVVASSGGEPWRGAHAGVHPRGALSARGAGLPLLLQLELCVPGAPPTAVSRPSSQAAPTLSHQGPGRRPLTPRGLHQASSTGRRKRPGWGRGSTSAPGGARKTVLYQVRPPVVGRPDHLEEEFGLRRWGSCRWRLAIWGIPISIQKSTLSHTPTALPPQNEIW